MDRLGCPTCCRTSGKLPKRTGKFLKSFTRRFVWVALGRYNSISAIQHLVDAAGSSANFEESELMNLLNDTRAVAGHFMVGSYQIDTAGRVLLGLDAGDPAF